MNTRRLLVALVFAMSTLAAGGAAAQDVAKLVTKAEVEKITGVKLKDGWKPMPTQVMFQQEGGDLQVSIDVEARDAASTVRSWEATIKRMQPSTKVDTVPGVGKDAIYYSTRPDSGALSADFDQPRVQLRVAVAGAKTPAQAKQIAVDLAKIAGPKVGR
ncbi:MAG: hypothetical protein ABI624_09255 [Casimicrobiaceae bacterium]